MFLTRDEAHHFLDDLLCPDRSWGEVLRRDPETFLGQLMAAYLARVPFQSLDALVTREVPSLEQVERDVLCRRGGLCFTMNVFFKSLLDALGFEAIFALCTIHGDTEHGTVLVRGLGRPEDLHCVEVGCGYILPAPLRVPAAAGAPATTASRHGRLEVELTRVERDGAIVFQRHHTAAGRRSLFWEMDIEPCSVEQLARAVRPTYQGYDRLRVVLAAGAERRMIAFKDDLLLQEDPCSGELRAHRFEDPGQRQRSLVEHLPWLQEQTILAGLGQAGWRRGSFHGRGAGNGCNFRVRSYARAGTRISGRRWPG